MLLPSRVTTPEPDFRTPLLSGVEMDQMFAWAGSPGLTTVCEVYAVGAPDAPLSENLNSAEPPPLLSK